MKKIFILIFIIGIIGCSKNDFIVIPNPDTRDFNLVKIDRNFNTKNSWELPFEFSNDTLKTLKIIDHSILFLDNERIYYNDPVNNINESFLLPTGYIVEDYNIKESVLYVVGIKNYTTHNDDRATTVQYDPFFIYSFLNEEENVFYEIEIVDYMKDKKRCDSILINKNKVIVVDNMTFPKYLLIFELADNGIPIFLERTDFQNRSIYGGVVNSLINNKWFTCLEFTFGGGSLGHHITIYDNKSYGTLTSIYIEHKNIEIIESWDSNQVLEIEEFRLYDEDIYFRFKNDSIYLFDVPNLVHERRIVRNYFQKIDENDFYSGEFNYDEYNENIVEQRKREYENYNNLFRLDLDSFGDITFFSITKNKIVLIINENDLFNYVILDKNEIELQKFDPWAYLQ